MACARVGGHVDQLVADHDLRSRADAVRPVTSGFTNTCTGPSSAAELPTGAVTAAMSA